MHEERFAITDARTTSWTPTSARWLLAGLVLAALMNGSRAGAQDTGDAAAQANNPLANMTTLNFQDHYIGRITETDEDGNQLWVRFVKPFSVAKTNWLMRASPPVNSYPVASDGGVATGIGDMNVFAAYLFDTGNPAVSFGLGPQITAPTAPDERLGSEKWSAGFANVLFDGRSKRLQYGCLLTWQASFAGSDDRADVNLGALQPFAFYQLSKGLYLRSAQIWVHSFDNDAYSVPLGLGIGQVITRGIEIFEAHFVRRENAWPGLVGFAEGRELPVASRRPATSPMGRELPARPFLVSGRYVSQDGHYQHFVRPAVVHQLPKNAGITLAACPCR
jgi:hypothetical protein